jgi:hypothetical protein
VKKKKKAVGGPIARLVMSGMMGYPIRAHEEVRHIDGDVTNCNPENLEFWIDGENFGKPLNWRVANARYILAMYGGEFPIG